MFLLDAAPHCWGYTAKASNHITLHGFSPTMSVYAFFWLWEGRRQQRLKGEQVGRGKCICWWDSGPKAMDKQPTVQKMKPHFSKEEKKGAEAQVAVITVIPFDKPESSRSLENAQDSER